MSTGEIIALMVGVPVTIITGGYRIYLKRIHCRSEKVSQRTGS